MSAPDLGPIARELSDRLGVDRPGIEQPLTLEYIVEDAVDCLGVTSLHRWACADPSSDLPAELCAVLAEVLAHRLGLLAFPGPLPRAARVLPRLLAPGVIDRLTRDAVRRCGPQPAVTRLETPWTAVVDRAAALREIAAEEWVGCDPAEVACGGEELVYACARLLAAAALVAAADDGVPNAVNAARRYAWRWLRLPLPEAVIPAHFARTRDLADYVRRHCGDVTQLEAAPS